MRALGVAVVAALFSGCLNHFEAQPAPHSLRLSEIDVAAPMVLSGTIVFAINTTLDNTGGPSDPARLVVKAFDSATELLASTNSTDAGRLKKDETRTIETRLTLPRTTGYRFEVSVYEADRVVQTGATTVSNVQALTPNVFETGLRISSMDFVVRNVTGNRVVVETVVYVTNEGGRTSQDLRLQLKARDVATSLVADDADAALAPIAPEATKANRIQLDVPSEHNYEVEGVLWDGDFIVGRGSGHVQLLPTFTKPTTSDLVVSTPNLQDFVRSPGEGAAGGGATKTPFPGFALVAGSLAVALLFVRRRR